MSWEVVFLLVAVILFALASFTVSSQRVSLGWAGMFFVTLYLMFSSGLLPPK